MLPGLLANRTGHFSSATMSWRFLWEATIAHKQLNASRTEKLLLSMVGLQMSSIPCVRFFMLPRQVVHVF